MCAVLTSTLAPMEGGQPFRYRVDASSGELPLGKFVPGSAQFDAFEPGISQGDHLGLKPGESGTLSLWVDPAKLANAPALGWMIVSQDDPAGAAQADTIPAILEPTGP
jgi:hypothetical protein